MHYVIYLEDIKIVFRLYYVQYEINRVKFMNLLCVICKYDVQYEMKAMQYDVQYEGSHELFGTSF